MNATFCVKWAYASKVLPGAHGTNCQKENCPSLKKAHRTRNLHMETRTAAFRLEHKNNKLLEALLLPT